MAERRMLWRNISQSRKVNSLSALATILYDWVIPQTDCDGFIEAEADYLKYNVVPRRKDIPEEKIDGLVAEIVNAKLWDLYISDDGRKIVYVKKHDEMQKGMDKRKERPSLFGNKIKQLKKISLPYKP